ncbi:MAG: 2-oxoacid ferredoxin oxidoreductase [Desulfarculaceae bacterium]|nr:2-oxoacid ferredoxin oxidoreductase [Desulfarculaceae bacterium]
MVSTEDFDNDVENKWCPGCGNFPILDAMKESFSELDLPPEKLFLVSGIGQAGKTPNFLNCNMCHTLHGRALCVATGAKIANRNLNIVVNSGDGDCYGEGGNHFMAAIRRNIDLTLLVHNNQVYGLTKGQASPTSTLGMKTKMQRQGTFSVPFNPLAVAMVSGAGFVARGFAGDKEQLAGLIRRAMQYRGFAMIDILQPCVSFNTVNTMKWYKDRAAPVEETDHDESDLKRALDLVLQDPEETISTGLLYENKSSSPGDFHRRLDVLTEESLLDQSIDMQTLQSLLP